MQIDNTALTAALSYAASQLSNTTPLMQRLSLELLSATEENFAAQGRPAWAGWSPKTAARRRGGVILQDTGQLAASVTPWHSETVAGIGSNKVYAPVHQWGWADRNIPARPFLPMDAQGSLQPEAEAGLLDVVSAYLRTVMP